MIAMGKRRIERDPLALSAPGRRARRARRCQKRPGIVTLA
jgi:hypothetical protein